MAVGETIVAIGAGIGAALKSEAVRQVATEGLGIFARSRQQARDKKALTGNAAQVGPELQTVTLADLQALHTRIEEMDASLRRDLTKALQVHRLQILGGVGLIVAIATVVLALIP